jgi:geranylgeranyl reductase family protein
MLLINSRQSHRGTLFDTLIVGAGPAGSFLGYLLARRGQRVAIIDKQRFPRDKVCGGGISRKAIELIDFDLAPVVHRPIRGAFLTFRNRSTIVKDIDPPAGYTVVRSEFDQFLLDKACAAGARFFPDTRFEDLVPHQDTVTVRTSAGDLEARLVCAADDVASTVREKVFGKHIVRYVPSLEAIVHVNDSHLSSFGDRAVFDFGAMPHGYGWIFPKHDHLNVGVYSPYRSQTLRAHLDRFMACYRNLQRPDSIHYLGYVIPIRNCAKRFQSGRVWLLGDAAGLAESVFGEGIYFALKSAVLAAQAIEEDAALNDPLLYTKLLRLELLPELGASQWISKALYRFQDFAFLHLAVNEHANHDFAGLITGEVGYRQCIALTALHAFKWLRSPPLLNHHFDL